MNRICGLEDCHQDLLDLNQEPVPYERNDRLFTLHFCSEKCRDQHKEDDA